MQNYNDPQNSTHVTHSNQLDLLWGVWGGLYSEASPSIGLAKSKAEINGYHYR